MIVHLVSDRFALGGGMEHIFQIARGLPDVRFRIFALPKPGSRRADDRFKALKNVEIDNRGYGPKLVLDKKPDLVHIHHLRPLFEFYKNPFQKYPVPVIFTAHGLHLHKFEFASGSRGSAIQNRLKYRLRYWLEKKLFSRADRVIAVSGDDREFLEKKYGLRNVIYLSNGIDVTGGGSSRINRLRIRKFLNLPPDFFLFVTVARFDFQKGYDFLVRSIASMRAFIKQQKVGFVFVGDGPEMQPTKLLAEELRVLPFVFFLGERTDVPTVMKAGDVFLLPSRWEGLPIVLLECGLLRVPVIASDTYGNREIIGKENGVLFENLNGSALANAIKKSVSGDYDFKLYTANLYEEVRKNYNLDKMLSGLNKIYTSLSG
jgi:glycosyltransferase involved in cell wall biosynthesis